MGDPLVANDGIGLAEALLGLEGFRVLAVAEGPAELVVTIETVANQVGCGSCGVRAEAQDRMPIDIRCTGAARPTGRSSYGTSARSSARSPATMSTSWSEPAPSFAGRR
jgi:hypothetical protein